MKSRLLGGPDYYGRRFPFPQFKFVNHLKVIRALGPVLVSFIFPQLQLLEIFLPKLLFFLQVSLFQEPGFMGRSMEAKKKLQVVDYQEQKVQE